MHIPPSTRFKFIRGMGTPQALAMVTSLYKQHYSKALPTYVAYLDLESAFCAVPQWAIKKTLQRLNIPDWAIDLMNFIDVGGLHQRHHRSQTHAHLSGAVRDLARLPALTAEVHRLDGSSPLLATR